MNVLGLRSHGVFFKRIGVATVGAEISLIVSSGGKYFWAPITCSCVDHIIVVCVSSGRRKQQRKMGKILNQWPTLHCYPLGISLPITRSPSDYQCSNLHYRKPVWAYLRNDRKGVKVSLKWNKYAHAHPCYKLTIRLQIYGMCSAVIFSGFHSDQRSA